MTPPETLDDLFGPGSFDEYCEAMIASGDPPDVPLIFQSRHLSSYELGLGQVLNPDFLDTGEWIRTLAYWPSIGYLGIMFSEDKVYAGEPGFCVSAETGEICDTSDFVFRLQSLGRTNLIEFAHKQGITDAYGIVANEHKVGDWFTETIHDYGKNSLVHIPCGSDSGFAKFLGR